MRNPANLRLQMNRVKFLMMRILTRRAGIAGAILMCAASALMMFAPPAHAQFRQREPNSEYAARRGRLRAQVDGAVVIFGYTGKESASEAYVFNQESNFYYLTGHNEEHAVLLLVPNGAETKGWAGPKEIFYLFTRNLQNERWDGPRIGPDDPGVQEKTGFADVRNFTRLAADLQQLAKIYPTFYTMLPHAYDAGYPHAQDMVSWLNQNLPGTKLAQIESQIGALRQIK